MCELITFLKTEIQPTSTPDDYYHIGCTHTTTLIDGDKYGILTKLNGKSITINESASDRWYTRYYELIAIAFPNAPFDISLSVEELLNLDEPFTDERTIVIKDTRATPKKYYWEEYTQSELNKYISHIIVKKPNNQSITLRQILNVMINNDEYKKMAELDEPHMFLEGFQKTTKIQYTSCFGS